MAAPDWVSYLAAGTGIAGAAMAWVGLRRAAQLKALDLRLELRKKDADFRSALDALPGVFEKGRRSRAAIDAATGMHGSGASQQWHSDLEADGAALDALRAAIPATPDDFANLSPAALENKLVEIHRLNAKVDELNEKYRASLAADDKRREHLHRGLLERGPQGGEQRKV